MAGKRKQVRFAVGGLLILGAMAYLVYSGMQGSMVYYMTVGELKAKVADESLYERGVRVSGKVAHGSIERDDRSRQHKFQIIEGAMTLPVSYRGSLPDMFKDGADVVVEGHYTRDGTLLATTLLTSCPSKYEPTEENGKRSTPSSHPASDT